MFRENITYQIDGRRYRGFLTSPDDKKRRPAILIAHAWRGQDEFARKKAEALAELGYVGFASDLYGEGRVAETDEDCLALMTPLFQDRALLQKRVVAAFNTVKQHRLVDTDKIGGIGFCFGGLTIIELLRSGVDVKGVVSFHGVLGHQNAKTVPISDHIKGSLLILHGYDDPLVTPNDISEMQQEMTKAKVDWQMNIYGHTSHAFTNPIAQDKAKGLLYNPVAEKRSWLAMRNFFEEIFSKV